MAYFAARLEQIRSLNLLKFMAYGLLVSLFLLPGITLSSSLPEIRPEDLLAYGLLLTLLLNAATKIKWSGSIQRFMVFIALFMVWMGITQLGNLRLMSMSDYFEYYKMFKFGIIALGFYLIHRHGILDQTDTLRAIRFIFYVTFALNMLHYFNILAYNPTIMPYYSSELHLSQFGVNSLGEPDVKRMLGVMGNPNNNSIIMGFFSIFFIVHSSLKTPEWKQNVISAGLALIMLLMSGSKTGVLSLVAVFVVYWVLSKANIKQFFVLGGITIMAFGLINALNFTYISSLWTVDWTANASWTGRLEVWENLIGMIQKSPWIGYGPNKEYFYANSLYSENEYVLMAWRYGVIGLLFYLGWIFIPFFTALGQKTKPYARILILFSTMLLVSALTNNPLSEPRVMALYAILCGFMFADRDQEPLREPGGMTRE